MTVYKILVTSVMYGESYLLDGRDRGGRWITYDREVAERKLAELVARKQPGVKYEIVDR